MQSPTWILACVVLSMSIPCGPSAIAAVEAPARPACAEEVGGGSFEELLRAAECLRTAGLAQGAIALHQRAVENKTGGSRELFLGLGLSHEASGDRAEALRSFDAAVLRGAGDADLFYHRGLAREELGDDRGALADFRRTVALRPEDGNAHRNIGFVPLRMDRAEEASVALQEAIRLDPLDSKA